MRASPKHFSDVTITYIEVEETDGPIVVRTEAEALREVVRGLKANGEQPDVLLSLPMFERMLQAVAVGLIHGSRE